MVKDAVGPGGDQEVGDQLGGDGHAGLVLAVLPGVTVKGQNGGDARGAGAAHRVHHDEQLHQVMVGGRAGGLDDEDILAADIFLDFDEGFAIGKGADGAFAQLHADGGGDALGQRDIGRAAKNFHRFGFAQKNKTTADGGSRVTQSCNKAGRPGKPFARKSASLPRQIDEGPDKLRTRLSHGFGAASAGCGFRPQMDTDEQRFRKRPLC